MNLATVNDEILILESFQQGDEKSFAYFFDKHYKALCYFANNITQEEQQGEDIVSDCFLKLWDLKGDFKAPQNIKAFLYISCRNACLNHLRSAKRLSSKQEVYLSQLDSSEDSILVQLIESEVLDILNQEIEELPEKCKEVFKLIYQENKKTDEIAELLGISVKTVRGHKARAVELLKTQILKKGLSSLQILALLIYIDSL